MTRSESLGNTELQAQEGKNLEYFKKAQALAENVCYAASPEEKEKAKIELIKFLTRKIEAHCWTFFRINSELLAGKVDVDDLIQEAKITLYRKCEKWHPEFINEETGENVKFYYWFFRRVLPRVLAGKFLNHYKRAKRDPRKEAMSLDEQINDADGEEMGEKQDLVADTSKSPEQLLSDAEIGLKLRGSLKEIEGFDKKDKRHPLRSLIIILRYFLKDPQYFKEWQETFRDLTLEQLKKTDQKHYNDITKFVRGDEEVMSLISRAIEEGKGGLSEQDIARCFSHLTKQRIDILEEEICGKLKGKIAESEKV